MKAIEYWYDDNCFCISQTDTATWIRGHEDDEYTFACNANPTIKLTKFVEQLPSRNPN